MKEWKLYIARTPVLGRAVLLIYRARVAFRYLSNQSKYFIKWLYKSKEVTNFTYDLEENNKRYLASLIADVLNMEFDTIMEYIREIEGDIALRRHVSDMVESGEFAFMADKDVKFGRRVGWYAFARATKPNIIIETGVDKGLGSCILCAALKRNKDEGYDGKYYGTDINPNAGFMLSGEYSEFGDIWYGDSIKSLEKFDDTVDLFINDSDHSADYEAKEYQAIGNKLSEKAIVLGDNSHCTDNLFNFSLKAKRHFIFFQERPSEHWYPGGGIGICFKRQ